MTETRTEKRDRMEEIDWTVAPTVHRFVAENAAPQIVDRRSPPAGIASAMREAIERYRTMAGITEVLDRIFTPGDHRGPGPDGSVTRMAVEIFHGRGGDATRHMLHLLMWDGSMLGVEIRRNPYPEQWNHTIYTLGIRPKDGDWTWRDCNLVELHRLTRREALHTAGGPA